MPITKIISRYGKSHTQAAQVSPWVDRMYLFDNAVDGEPPVLCAWAVAGRWQVNRDKALPVWAAPIVILPAQAAEPGHHRGWGCQDSELR